MTAAIISAALYIPFFRTAPGSVAISYITLAFVMTSVIFILDFVKLAALDYAAAFACFVCLGRYSGFETRLFGISLPALYVFAVICALYMMSDGRSGGRLFGAWTAAALTVAEGFICDYLFTYHVRAFGYTFFSNAAKLAVWAAAAAIIISANAIIIYAVKKIFGAKLAEINEMGRAHPKIERNFIFISAGILLATALFNFIYVAANGYARAFGFVFSVFAAGSLAIQLAFLILIFKITRLNENLRDKTLENASLAGYTSSLEKNIDEIKGIKHDIKNIFITMGGFVEKSGDDELRDFFRAKISPFIDAEIAKSDLFGKLAMISDEPLKAFLFYKISQALERGVDVELEIAEPHNGTAPPGGLAFADLTRVLGILADNAIEECMTLENARMAIKISRNEESISYAIKNTVSETRRKTGVRAGVSTKEDGRGMGLNIIKRILEKYDCAALNSYFSDEFFVQGLVVYNDVR